MAHILLVDDDISMLEFVRISLEKAGYTVTAVDSGDKALEIFTKKSDFDLVLTDIVMKGLDGLALADKIKAAKPTIKVMFMTGFTAMAPAMRIGNSKVMAKPFHLKDLVAHVSSLLAE